MRLTLVKNSNAVSYFSNDQYYFEATENSPAKVLKDLFWDCLYVLRMGEPANFYVDGKIETLSKELLKSVLERIDTDTLLDINTCYITGGDWRFALPAEYSLSEWIESILTEREGKSLAELSELKLEHRKNGVQECQNIRNNKNFQKLLRGLETNPVYSLECRELLKVMKEIADEC